MSMFDNYYIEQTIVNNFTKPSTSYSTMEDFNRLPRKIYSIKDTCIGYGWHYGDTFTLTLSVENTIKVAEDAIVYDEKGLCPSIATEGYVGQQAYNTVDCKSWTCSTICEGIYFWVEDDYVIYPNNGTREINFTPDMTDKKLIADIFNFRWEPIHTFSNLGAARIDCNIDKDISDKLKPGVYYCTLKVTSESSCNIKNKFMFIVE